MLTKITEYGSVKSAGGTKARRNASSVGSFADLLDAAGAGDDASVGALSDVAAPSAVGGMLSLQEVAEEEGRRKKLVSQGHSMLDTLDELRHRLIEGRIPGHMLADLGQEILAKKQTVTDPALVDIIEDIEIRLAVELAKLELAARGSDI